MKRLLSIVILCALVLTPITILSLDTVKTTNNKIVKHVNTKFDYLTMKNTDIVFNKHLLPIDLNLTGIKVNSNYQNGSIIRLHNNNDRFFCTGFVISDNYAITAAHCVTDEFGFISEKDIFVYNSRSRYTNIIAHAYGANTRMDYAVIQGDFSSFAKKKIDQNLVDIKDGNNYMSCGFPIGIKRLFCTEVRVEGTSFFSIRGQGHLYPGMSGGPLIDLRNGKVVGVNSYAAEGYVGFYPTIGILSAFGLN